jgi:D-glycero-alpha-D-manno-heptose 1-phosphate guanylyltransferase
MKTAIILAGGFGTRLRSVVTDVPKPMAPIRGRPFLEILLTYWRKQGIEHFILSIGYMAHVIQNHFGQRWQDCTISYSVESEPLGTGGAIFLACKPINDEESFLVLNGDTFFPIDMKSFEEFHILKKSDVTLGVFQSNDTKRYMGLSTNYSHRITSLHNKDITQGHLVNGGIYAIKKSTLRDLEISNEMPQSWENYTLPNLLADKKNLFAKAYAREFIDIGLPDDYERAQNILY